MVFIGRESELKDFGFVLDAFFQEKRGAFINIAGEGGVGKSELLRQFINIATIDSRVISGAFNLSETTNQTPLLLADNIASVLGNKYFSRFEQALSNHIKAELENKIEMEIQALAMFIQDLTDLSKECFLLLVLDTFESVAGKRVSYWMIEELIKKIAQSVLVIVAGRQPITIPNPNLSIKLERFSDVETHLLAKALFKERGEIFELSRAETDIIHEKTAGSPILATLAFEWLLETGNLDDILSMPSDMFAQDLAVRFRLLKDEDENVVLALMTILDRRFNSEIYANMVSMNEGRIKLVLDNLRRFSFIKYYEDSGLMFLHDEFRSLLQKYGAIPADLYIQTSRNVVERYYHPMLVSQALEQFRRQPIMLDIIYYMLRYSPNDAFDVFNQEYAFSLAEYELGHCNNLIQIIRSGDWSDDQIKYIDILEGELLLKQYNPFDAARIFERLCATEVVIKNPIYMSRSFEGLANCLTMGCEIAGDDMSNALTFLQKALTLAQVAGDKVRSANILLDTGIALRALGKFEEAFRYLSDAIIDAVEIGDTTLAANVTDYLMNILQLTGKPLEGREWGLKGLEWRTKLGHKNELLKSYKRLATNYAYAIKDQTDKQTSLDYFRKAINLCIELKDHFILAGLYMDLGWVYFKVFNDNAEALACAEKGMELCSRYGFGKIKGEIFALKFDVAESQNDLDTALPFLTESIEILRKHGGYYHLLHMLSHKVLIAKQSGQYNQIALCIEEMETYIKKGVVFRVFYGRSLVLWGDCALENREYALAFERYHLGYYNLALAGQHGAWEAWGAYKQLIRDRLPNVLGTLDNNERKVRSIEFIDYWNKVGLGSTYPDLIDLCKSFL